MPTLHLATLAAFQTAPDSGYLKLIAIFIGLVALSMLAQGIAVVIVGIKTIQAQKEIMPHILELKAKALPLLAKSEEIADELRPRVNRIAARVETIADHVEHLAGLVHEKADEIAPTVSAANETALEVNAKARAQVSRVDRIVTSALDATVRLGIAIEQGIAKPAKEVAGVLTGLRAGFGVFLRASRPAIKPSTTVPRRPDGSSGFIDPARKY